MKKEKVREITNIKEIKEKNYNNGFRKILKVLSVLLFISVVMLTGCAKNININKITNEEILKANSAKEVLGDNGKVTIKTISCSDPSEHPETLTTTVKYYDGYDFFVRINNDNYYTTYATINGENYLMEKGKITKDTNEYELSNSPYLDNFDTTSIGLLSLDKEELLSVDKTNDGYNVVFKEQYNNFADDEYITYEYELDKDLKIIYVEANYHKGDYVTPTYSISNITYNNEEPLLFSIMKQYIERGKYDEEVVIEDQNEDLSFEEATTIE